MMLNNFEHISFLAVDSDETQFCLTIWKSIEDKEKKIHFFKLKKNKTNKQTKTTKKKLSFQVLDSV